MVYGKCAVFLADHVIIEGMVHAGSGNCFFSQMCEVSFMQRPHFGATKVQLKINSATCIFSTFVER